MIFAEEFTTECFEEIIFVESTQTQVRQTNTHVNRCAIRLREEGNELEIEFIDSDQLASIRSKLTAVRLSIKGLLHTSTCPSN